MDLVEVGQPILILIGAFAGFLVGQANGFFDRRSQERKAYSRALAELLEIRHRFKGAVYMLRRIGCDIEVPREYLDEIVQGLPDGLLWDKSVSDRYADAVSTLSAYAPLSAYLLRSKDIVGFFVNGSPVSFGTSESSHSFAMKNLEIMEEAVVSALEESIEGVSRFLGRKKNKLTKKILEDTQDVLPEVKSSTDELIANANIAIAAETKQ